MSEGINVRLPGKLQAFVKEKCDPAQGYFSSSSEYIRDLIRRDFEKDERTKWEGLRRELAAGMRAEESGFLELGAEGLIAEAKQRKAAKAAAAAAASSDEA